MRGMKKIIIYKGIPLTVLFAFAFVFFCYATSAPKIKNKELDALKHNSDIQLFTVIFDEAICQNESNDYFDLLDNYINTCNVKQIGIYNEFVPDKYSGIEGATILFEAFDFGYPLYEGVYPSKQQLRSGENYAVISMSRKKDVYLENKKEYININGTKFEVTGYFSKYSEWMFENKILMVASVETARKWKWLSAHNLAGNNVFTFCSDDFSDLSVYHKKNHESKYVKYCSDIFILNDNSYPYGRSMAPTDYQINMYRVLVVFCILVLAFTIELLFCQRKKEFEILSKHGISIFQIICKIYIELMGFCYAGVILGGLFALGIIYYFDGYIQCNISSIYDYFATSVIFTVCIVILSSFYSVFKTIIKYTKHR